MLLLERFVIPTHQLINYSFYFFRLLFLVNAVFMWTTFRIYFNNLVLFIIWIEFLVRWIWNHKTKKKKKMYAWSINLIFSLLLYFNIWKVNNRPTNQQIVWFVTFKMFDLLFFNKNKLKSKEQINFWLSFLILWPRPYTNIIFFFWIFVVVFLICKIKIWNVSLKRTVH